ncbi:capsule biosynthesis GfcC family protein [Dyella sp. C11]|uniref:capsule biosynthesis GfcC family protein n=1 Tax=Dyella sp. C11 TaxID=2126991 RepID=UPI000D65AB55|nr:capsule biosynthesis GfcC family protein [Dyella sp. C11]
MRLRSALLCLGLLASLGVSSGSVATQVDVRGAVNAGGTRNIPAGARLSQAALSSPLHRDAYTAGAAWLRPALQAAQSRDKAGVLFDLNQLRLHALKDEHDGLADLAARMASWVQRMPVTGRQVALLDPRALEVTPAENKPVAEGDALYYPTRPSTIRVVGAVAAACELPHVALQDAMRYLKACPLLKEADNDWIFVIQPDGRVFRQGMGAWNRSHPLSLAPGAVVYVPISEYRLKNVAPDLNRELANFLATQPIAWPEAQP